MRETLRSVFLLGLILMACVGLSQARAEEEAGFKDVLAQAESFQAVKSGNEILFYKAFAQDKKFMGVVFKAKEQGYSSPIEALVGMQNDGKICAVKILSQNETPGAGARVSEPEFTSQFKGKNAQNLSGVQAISGATISSQAVMEAVKKKAAEIKAYLKEEKQ